MSPLDCRASGDQIANPKSPTKEAFVLGVVHVSLCRLVLTFWRSLEADFSVSKLGIKSQETKL